MTWPAMPGRYLWVMTSGNEAGDGMTINAVSWHDSILPQPLRFAPPYAETSTNPDGFSYFWQLAEYAFHLPNPAKLPEIRHQLSDDERARVTRFIQSCIELATYSFMSAPTGVSVSVANGVESVTTEFSSREVTRGTVTLFRQLYGTDSASYKDAVGILSSAHKATRDSEYDEREDIIVPWRRAHGALCQQRIQAIVGRKAADAARQGAGASAPLAFEDIRPTEVLSRYMYGDLIHWGDQRAALAALGTDEFHLAMDQMHFIEAMTGLAHYYLGFSVLLSKAFASQL